MFKKIFFILVACLTGTLLLAQNKEEAEKLVEEGIAYYDKGDYEGALDKYDKALEADKDNLFALSEKAMTFQTLEKNEEAIQLCQYTIEKHKGDKDLGSVYVTYGNALDALKKTDKSIQVYNEGIAQYPNEHQLYFNKAVSLASVKKYQEALPCFQKSAMLKPRHASSHNAIARIADNQGNTVPSILAYCRFLSIEPQSERGKENLYNLQKLLRGNAEISGKNQITINIKELKVDSTEKGKKENDFSTVDLILQMSSALELSKKEEKNNEIKRFTEKLETIIGSLKESKKDNFGFYWDYYVPYFIEMKEKNYLETFAYIAYASSDKDYIQKWLKKHDKDIDEFFAWSKEFKWKTDN